MAASLGSAQHYIECDNCEENPAKYVCKTCPGNLCENCKTEHENRKITKDHEVTDFKTGNKDFDCYLFCPDHKSKKLECFCDSCKKPVCTECIVSFHNGHAVQSLSAAYKEIKDQQQKQITKIEDEVRNYISVLQGEEQKESDLTKKVDEVEKQIMKHTSNVVEMVNEISKRDVQELRLMEQKGRNEINKSIDVIRRNVEKLTQTKDKLSANIEAKPGVSFFQNENSDLLDKVKEDMEETILNLTKYELDDFHPGKICDIIPTCFGTLPDLRKIQPLPSSPPTRAPPPRQLPQSLLEQIRQVSLLPKQQQPQQPQLRPTSPAPPLQPPQSQENLTQYQRVQLSLQQPTQPQRQQHPPQPQRLQQSLPQPSHTLQIQQPGQQLFPQSNMQQRPTQRQEQQWHQLPSSQHFRSQMPRPRQPLGSPQIQQQVPRPRWQHQSSYSSLQMHQQPSYPSSQMQQQQPFFPTSQMQQQQPSYPSSQMQRQQPSFPTSQMQQQQPSYPSSQMQQQQPSCTTSHMHQQPSYPSSQMQEQLLSYPSSEMQQQPPQPQVYRRVRDRVSEL